MINRKIIKKISAYFNLKNYLSEKFSFQNLIKTEVALVEPPPFIALPDAAIFIGSAHLIYEGETDQLKKCTCIRKAYFARHQIVVPELIQRFDLICKITRRF